MYSSSVLSTPIETYAFKQLKSSLFICYLLQFHLYPYHIELSSPFVLRPSYISFALWILMEGLSSIDISRFPQCFFFFDRIFPYPVPFSHFLIHWNKFSSL